MDSTKQGFLKDQPRHFGVVLFFHVGKGRQNTMRLWREPYMRTLEGFAQAASLCSSIFRLMAAQ